MPARGRAASKRARGRRAAGVEKRAAGGRARAQGGGGAGAAAAAAEGEGGENGEQLERAEPVDAPEEGAFEEEVVEEYVLLRVGNDPQLGLEAGASGVRVEGLGTLLPSLVSSSGARYGGHYEHVVGCSVLVGGAGTAGPEGLAELVKERGLVQAGQQIEATVESVKEAAAGTPARMLAVATARCTMWQTQPAPAPEQQQQPAEQHQNDEQDDERPAQEEEEQQAQQQQ